MFGSGINSLIALTLVCVSILALQGKIWTQSMLFFGITGGSFIVSAYCFHSLTQKFGIREPQKIKWEAIKEVYA